MINKKSEQSHNQLCQLTDLIPTQILMKRLSLILLALWFFACKQAPPPITEQPMSPEIEVKLYELLKRVPYTSSEYPGLEFLYSNVADIPTHLDPVFGKVDISLIWFIHFTR